MKVLRITFEIPSWSYHFTRRLAASSNPLWMKLTWRESRSHVTLPLIYSATKKVLTIPLDAQAGTTARDEMLFLFGTIATLVTSTR